MSETNDYDKIFTALKHPLRRQILLLLEEKGETSFTQIQNATDTDDTGLLSYHLKELAPLVKQTTRGRYSLSEIGEASMALFRKVETEKQALSSTVQKYLEKVIGEAFFLFLIAGITLMTPLSVDIYLSVQSAYSSLPTEQLTVLFLVSLSGMIIGTVLFVFYDRHYFSKRAKANVAHSLLFSLGISLLSVYSAYVNLQFEMETANGSSCTFWFNIARTLCFLISTPMIAYVLSSFLNRR